MRKELLIDLSTGNEYFKLNQLATNNDIIEVEKKLGIKLPSDLKDLLMEFNGDNRFDLTLPCTYL